MFNVSTIEARIVKSEADYNGKPFIYEYIGLFIDGVQVKDSIDYFAIVFPDPQRISADFYPFTCSCGHAGCAGWDYGYKLKFRKYTVEWSAIHPEEVAEQGKRRFYSFARGQYESLQRRILDLLEEIAENRGKGPQFPDDENNPYGYDTMLRATNREDAIYEIDRIRQYRKKYFTEWKFATTPLTRYGRCA